MNVLRLYKLAFLSAIFFTSQKVSAQTSPNITDQAQTQTLDGDRVKANWQPSLVTDGVYDRVPHVNQPLPWQPIREADVMWRKRVWREIDARQKQNMAFRFPGDDFSGGGMFIEILLDALKKGAIKGYSTADDRFTTPMSKDQILELTMGKTDTNYVIDPVTEQQVMRISHRDFNPDLVTKFRIKEDYIFDRNQGRMVVRIIGLAPMMDKYSEEDQRFLFSYPMFWIYYPELRETLAKYEVYNPENDARRMTWDEFFENRFFSSYIIKVSNPFDANFNQLGLQGTDALYEGQRVQEELFNKDADMWVY